MSAAAPRLSGIQRDVLSLYRSCLRMVRAKPLDSQANFRAYARAEFREHLGVGKKDFATIEHLLRVGRRKLETYSQPGVRNIQR
ncbi:complex 1 protein-domain-containing protein [Tricharina praecox]|uniref:complex 1 protein-domain-containing protein n=1 Tax=Tricharina praecox TaxID=43433 RepID=UPI0022209667|nr:complex 1 protein-domain-containing protein [Tricharina praecox]KAI5849962.1 complex 1 protein-domain-containing protein [Tricharina praecox]